MSFKSIPAQEDMLYDGLWTAEVDAAFLNALVQMKHEGKWNNLTSPPYHVVEAARAIAKETSGRYFTPGDIVERMKMYEVRYKTFSKMMNMPETYWDPQRNIVTAHSRIWKEIFKQNSFARAYYYEGEPEFNNLANIFGPTTPKHEDGPTIIVISDSTTIEVPSDSEEVNSLTVAKQNRRRCLFKSHSGVVDEASTNNLESGEFEQAFPLRNAFPGPPKRGAFTPASSCASSSPNRFTKNPFM